MLQRRRHEIMIKQEIGLAYQFVWTGHRLDDLRPPLSTTLATRLRLCDLGTILLGISWCNIAHIPIFLNCDYVHHTVVYNCWARRGANRSRVEDLALVNDGTYRVNGEPAAIRTRENLCPNYRWRRKWIRGR